MTSKKVTYKEINDEKELQREFLQAMAIMLETEVNNDEEELLEEMSQYCLEGEE